MVLCAGHQVGQCLVYRPTTSDFASQGLSYGFLKTVISPPDCISENSTAFLFLLVLGFQYLSRGTFPLNYMPKSLLFYFVTSSLRLAFNLPSSCLSLSCCWHNTCTCLKSEVFHSRKECTKHQSRCVHPVFWQVLRFYPFSCSQPGNPRPLSVFYFPDNVYCVLSSIISKLWGI